MTQMRKRTLMILLGLYDAIEKSQNFLGKILGASVTRNTLGKFVLNTLPLGDNGPVCRKI